MRAIGFRCTPNEIFYSIVEEKEDKFSIVNVEKIKLPTSQSMPEKLHHLRTSLIDTIREFDVKRAGIRTAESSAKKQSPTRFNIEGVIQEVFCASDVEKHFVGEISTIMSKLRIEKTEFKKMVSGQTSHCIGINLTNYNETQREAIIVATASLFL